MLTPDQIHWHPDFPEQIHQKVWCEKEPFRMPWHSGHSIQSVEHHQDLLTQHHFKLVVIHALLITRIVQHKLLSPLSSLFLYLCFAVLPDRSPTLFEKYDRLVIKHSQAIHIVDLCSNEADQVLLVFSWCFIQLDEGHCLQGIMARIQFYLRVRGNKSPPRMEARKNWGVWKFQNSNHKWFKYSPRRCFHQCLLTHCNAPNTLKQYMSCTIDQIVGHFVIMAETPSPWTLFIWMVCLIVCCCSTEHAGLVEQGKPLFVATRLQVRPNCNEGSWSTVPTRDLFSVSYATK